MYSFRFFILFQFQKIRVVVLWECQFVERVAYFIGYAFAVFLLCSNSFKAVCFIFIFAFQLSYSVPGLIYRCIAVERTGKIFTVFLLGLFGQILELCTGFFPLEEVFLRISFPEYFFSCLLVFVIDCSARAQGRFFLIISLVQQILKKFGFFSYKNLRLDLQQIVVDFGLCLSSMLNLM